MSTSGPAEQPIPLTGSQRDGVPPSPPPRPPMETASSAPDPERRPTPIRRLLINIGIIRHTQKKGAHSILQSLTEKE
ncbi:MAG: hypothetical protein PHO20_01735 [Candidatus Peribacteraceae bacterium]|nr:hypothetical protein [Candidatus Peribacteraceae bacterium]MDD5739467.1 hypothetical protein [Candidatus Peribacteraceae bacterium]